MIDDGSRQVDVPGSRPSGRFGAGIELDLTNYYLYIIVSAFALFCINNSMQGGTGYTSGTGFVNYGDLYVFQLTDAFYKSCSATGQALTSALAGVNTVFYLQCQVSTRVACEKELIADMCRTTSDNQRREQSSLLRSQAQTSRASLLRLSARATGCIAVLTRQ